MRKNNKNNDFFSIISNIIRIQYLVIIIIILCIVYLFYFTNNSYKNQDIIIKNNIPSNKLQNYNNPFGLYSKKNDIYLNPYTPPLKNDYYIPINIPTNNTYVGNRDYRQVGILTSNMNKTKILPLFSRPINRNRNNYNYYTLDDKNNIKLPILFHNKSCLSENGCDEIYSKDKVYVKGYNEFFLADIYENETMRYLPYI